MLTSQIIRLSYTLSYTQHQNADIVPKIQCLIASLLIINAAFSITKQAFYHLFGVGYGVG